MRKIVALIFILQWIYSSDSFSQKAYFIDGYHGGVYGHYPDWNTRFMADMLKKNPNWKINLEIEPETWDTAMVKDLEAYKSFKALFEDQSLAGRIEYVNPGYGQSYLYNTSGESMIRQFSLGMKKVREHFPTAVFTTYSSEEPCFTSALPQILTSFGYKYASLKNPNTCWGGYTSAFGGELVNWVGPDGTKIVTVPRYEIEALKPGSTWETIANRNSPRYIQAAFDYGIANPVGMTLQDAGWRNGPWLGDGRGSYQPTEYKTWRGYFENASIEQPNQDWKFSQEDVLVSLVWGSQVLQRIAQQIRTSENKIVAAEKLASMASFYGGTSWPRASFDEAWRTLLLAQHHDCWIVPYNGKPGDTWADKVVDWTNFTNQRSDSVAYQAMQVLGKSAGKKDQTYVRVFNTVGVARKELVTVALPENWDPERTKVLDSKNREVPVQRVSSLAGAKNEIVFLADVPSVGYNTFKLQKAKFSQSKGAKVSEQKDGTYQIETDLYRIVLNPSKGGTIESLVAKRLGGKEFVDVKNERRFNEIRGHFYEEGGFHSSAQSPAEISVLESGPARVSLEIKGTLTSHPYTQTIIVAEGQKRIDLNVKVEWKGNPGIGEYDQDKNYEATDNNKAFYNDKFKLLTLFPLNLESQKVYKNAPFDVTESRLENTFFTRWDSIKHNIVLNWVDVTDASNKYGMAMLTDHTTSYAHAEDHPLGLTLQYSGKGLWGRDYKITEPTEVNYALIPHAGKWDEGGIWTEGTRWNEPLVATLMDTAPDAKDYSKSMISIDGSGLEVTALTYDGNDLLVRLFNAEGDAAPKKITFDCSTDKVELVELNGNERERLKPVTNKAGKTVVPVSIPRFGIRTVKVSNARL